MVNKGATEDGLDSLGLLLAWHGKIADMRMRRALSSAGFTPRHARALTLLRSGPLSQQALIDLLGTDPSSMVALLTTLEDDGLVCRRRDPADRRRHIVEITPEGATALASLETSLAAADNELFAALSDEERSLLRTLLAKSGEPPQDGPCQEC
ncbi:MarR family winged helix-turn-helix transcriptional regulator [Streptomyces flaveolus]|uniref:MarR family winged helix-turn-helix transcriptional regulator n=1 Tax=Streptomyces flaveolus TaxID=67297 RepID=UPI0036FB032F